MMTACRSVTKWCSISRFSVFLNTLVLVQLLTIHEARNSFVLLSTAMPKLRVNLLSALLLWPVACLATQNDPLAYVNPLIGTINGGNVFAGATLPYGLAKAVADVDGANTGGFALDGSNVTSFSSVHDSVRPPSSIYSLFAMVFIITDLCTGDGGQSKSRQFPIVPAGLPVR